MWNFYLGEISYMSETVMDSVCRCLVRRYGPAACYEVEKTRAKDEAVTSAIKDSAMNTAERTRRLVKWISKYGVARVRWAKESENDGFAFAMSNAALAWFDGRNSPARDVLDNFVGLRKHFEEEYIKNMSKERSFLSLTSKVLWCSAPEHVPIYDDLAASSVSILQKIKRASFMEECPTRSIQKQRAKEQSIAEKDITIYGKFLIEHTSLFESFKPKIEDFLAQQEDKNSPYRVFDKLLWLIGAEE